MDWFERFCVGPSTENLLLPPEQRAVNTDPTVNDHDEAAV
jgi:hypothetical protein